MIDVLGQIKNLKYLAMFGILFLCGLGLPIPEEVTLIVSGVVVGLEQADFWLASLACVVGILAGDSIIFGLGHYYGRDFLSSRPMRFLLPSQRQARVSAFFRKHGNKTVFFARFFALVRVGVYAYAGSQRMRWSRFLFLDLLGALLSGPTSVWVGRWATRKFLLSGDVPFAELTEAEQQERIHQTVERAEAMLQEFGLWILLGVLAFVVIYFAVTFWRRRSSAKSQSAEEIASSDGQFLSSPESGKSLSSASPESGKSPSE